jgi:hypothetical protein
MRSEELYRSMSGIDDAILAGCLQPAKKKSHRIPYRALISVAACLVLVLGGAIFEPWQRFGSGISGGENSGIETSGNQTVTNQKAKSNFFVITANAAELPEDGEYVSGEVYSIRVNDLSTGFCGGYIPELFSIGGRNIAKVKLSADKNEIFTSKPLYKEDAEYPTDSEVASCNANPYTDRGYYNWVNDTDYKKYAETGVKELKYHYDYWQVQGDTYEAEYNANLSYGFFSQESINVDTGDLRLDYHTMVDMLEGTKLTITVTYENGQSEEHHYLVHSGKVLCEYNEDEYKFERQERFLTPEEEQNETTYFYSILIEQLD